MIIKLVGADFSANNIGTIAVNREVSEATKELLTNYTRNLTKSQQFAVQDFISGLKSNGLWSIIGNLYIPALASTVSETMFNIKTNKKDTTPSSEYYLLENNGLRTKYYDTNTEIPTSSRAVVKMNASYMNMHYMVYTDEQDTTFPSTEWKENYYLTTYKSGSGVYRGLRTTYNPISRAWNAILNGNPQKTVVSNTGLSTLNGFVGISCGSDGTFVGVINNSDSGQMGVTETTDTTITDIDTYVGCTVQGYAQCSNPMRIISMGTAMSKEQLLKYNELCDALIASICA